MLCDTGDQSLVSCLLKLLKEPYSRGTNVIKPSIRGYPNYFAQKDLKIWGLSSVLDEMWMCQNLPFPAALGSSSTPLYKAGSILWLLHDLVYRSAMTDNLLNYFYCINNPD